MFPQDNKAFPKGVVLLEKILLFKNSPFLKRVASPESVISKESLKKVGQSVILKYLIGQTMSQDHAIYHPYFFWSNDVTGSRYLSP